MSDYHARINSTNQHTVRGYPKKKFTILTSAHWKWCLYVSDPTPTVIVLGSDFVPYTRSSLGEKTKKKKPESGAMKAVDIGPFCMRPGGYSDNKIFYFFLLFFWHFSEAFIYERYEAIETKAFFSSRQGSALEGRNSPVFAKRFWKGNK